jgi:hypothetical protein
MTINLETPETVKMTEGYGTIVMLHEKGEIVDDGPYYASVMYFELHLI